MNDNAPIKLMDHLTPLKLVGLLALIITIKYVIGMVNLLTQGHEPGLGAIIPVFLAGLFGLIVGIDLLMIFRLKKRKVLIVISQIIIGTLFTYILIPFW